MQTLPLEAVWDIYLDLHVQDLLNQCSTLKNPEDLLSIVCNDVEFWDKYCQIHFLTEPD